jgi:hypothetical protein
MERLGERPPRFDGFNPPRCCGRFNDLQLSGHQPSLRYGSAGEQEQERFSVSSTDVTPFNPFNFLALSTNPCNSFDPF